MPRPRHTDHPMAHPCVPTCLATNHTPGPTPSLRPRATSPPTCPQCTPTAPTHAGQPSATHLRPPRMQTHMSLCVDSPYSPAPPLTCLAASPMPGPHPWPPTMPKPVCRLPPHCPAPCAHARAVPHV